MRLLQGVVLGGEGVVDVVLRGGQHDSCELALRVVVHTLVEADVANPRILLLLLRILGHQLAVIVLKRTGTSQVKSYESKKLE